MSTHHKHSTRHLLMAAFIALVQLPVWLSAQTADDYVAQGRSYLAATNLPAANASFQSAVAVAPAHPTANVLYAVTRLLTLSSQPAGSNFLSRLGFSTVGRSIYNWTASIPTDAQHVPVAPAGVNADETTDYLATTLVPELAGADANLAQVTDTNYSLTLTAAETRSTDVTIDYGDVQMLRAMVTGVQYFCHTIHSWNLDVQLSALRSFSTNEAFSLQEVLQAYPQLLTFTNTNDLASANVAFQTAVAHYVVASDLIRNRVDTGIGLFNIDGARVNAERGFRLTLIDLTNSMTGAVPLTVDSRFMVFLPAHFDGKHSMRSFLPEIVGNGFVLGSVPDTTFGGLFQGLPTTVVERFLAGPLRPIPSFKDSVATTAGSVEFTVNTVPERGYLIQSSTDLIHWTNVKVFVALSGQSSFAESTSLDGPQRYFRVIDVNANIPPPPNDFFADRIPLTGETLQTEGYNVGATYENFEQGWVYNTVWWTWTAPFTGTAEVTVEGARRGPPVAAIYTGASIDNLTQLSSDRVPFSVTAGVAYQIQVGSYDGGGAIKLNISRPPSLAVFSPTADQTFSGPTNLNISASATDLDGTVTNMSVVVNGKALINVAGGSLNFDWNITSPGVYFLDVVATDNVGVTTTASYFIIVRPANDDFANATPITSGVVMGSNGGSSKEPNEPDHGGQYGGSSVWWSWTATNSTLATVQCDMLSTSGYTLSPVVAVYTGSSLGSLTEVASGVDQEFTGTISASFTTTPGTKYYIAVDDTYGEQGNITLHVLTAPPTAATNPGAR